MRNYTWKTAKTKDGRRFFFAPGCHFELLRGMSIVDMTRASGAKLWSVRVRIRVHGKLITKDFSFPFYTENDGDLMPAYRAAKRFMKRHEVDAPSRIKRGAGVRDYPDRKYVRVTVGYSANYFGQKGAASAAKQFRKEQEKQNRDGI
jgi:hypothetical protein